MDRFREEAKNLQNKGTTPILESSGIEWRYIPVGRVYIDAAELMSYFKPILGEFCPEFAPFNDLPGPHPWDVKITLKNSFKKYMDKVGEPPYFPSR